MTAWSRRASGSPVPRLGTAAVEGPPASQTAVGSRRLDRVMGEGDQGWRQRLPDGSKSVQSVWVWRGFFFMSLIALGLVISFASEGLHFYAIAWAVIALGWFGISMWLWRKHVKDDDAALQAASTKGGRGR
jgi:hypothetical protein